MKAARMLIYAATYALTSACGPGALAVLPLGSVAADETALASDRFSEWSAAVDLGPVVNSPSTDFTPELSRDGLSLYFSSNRPGGFGLTDLYVAHRAGRDEPWGPPVNLGAVINTAKPEAGPHLSRDGHRLYFASGRPGGLGANDIWVSRRSDPNDDFGWEAPVNLGPGVNSSGFEGGMTLRLPELYVASDRANPGPDHPLHIYLSVIGPDGAFGPAVLVVGLSSAGNDLRPTIRFDGRELFLSSDRAGSAGGSQDIWVSTRAAFGAPWTPPVNLGAPVNTQYNEVQPSLSADGRILLFASDRPGGSGGADLYMATREMGKR